MLLLISNQKRNTYKYRRKLYNYGLRFENGKWRLRTSDEELIYQIASFSRRKHLHYECFEDKYTRSSNYRKTFIDHYQRKDGKYYRCAYCGKRLIKEKMTVDHIIPIDKVQHSWFYRRLIGLMNITNINDLKNLAPACERCNKKKGRKVKGFLLNGLTGRTYRGVIIRRWIKFVFAMVLIVALSALIYYLYSNYGAVFLAKIKPA